MKLAGITLVANGTNLGYPFKTCVKNLLSCCDQVYVATDIYNKDNTLQVLEEMKSIHNHLTILKTEWNWGITNGQDLAFRANQCLELAEKERNDYALYVQADEVINPKEINLLKFMLEKTWMNIALERAYFWKDLDYVNRDWTLHIPRLCAITPELRVIGDGMSMAINQRLPLIHMTPEIARIYHYSRVGNSQDIAKRLNNLDLLFHSPGEFQPLKDYIFGINNNYEQGCPEARIERVIVNHPPGIQEFYKEYK